MQLKEKGSRRVCIRQANVQKPWPAVDINQTSAEAASTPDNEPGWRQ